MSWRVERVTNGNLIELWDSTHVGGRGEEKLNVWAGWNSQTTSKRQKTGETPAPPRQQEDKRVQSCVKIKEEEQSQVLIWTWTQRYKQLPRQEFLKKIKQLDYYNLISCLYVYFATNVQILPALPFKWPVIWNQLFFLLLYINSC